MKVIILTCDKEVDYVKASYQSWKDMGYDNIEFYEVKRHTNNLNKAIMDNWKKYFNNNEIKEDLIIAEDDVIVKKELYKLKYEIDRKSINYLCFQNEISAGSIKVGSQAIYIPLNEVEYFKWKLNKNASKHFDRFMSRLATVKFPYDKKEFGEEIEHISLITNKLRLGKKI
jgi:hypothetical protein